MKKVFLTLATLIFFANLYANNFEEQFKWIQQTFLENDAGVPHIMERRGMQALEAHNQMILERVRAAETMPEFIQIANEWLRFFRGGHHRVSVSPNFVATNVEQPAVQAPPKTHPIPGFWDGDIAQFREYLTTLGDEPTYEGIWDIGGNYKIGIAREGSSYIGFIVESTFEDWLPNMIKLRINEDGDEVVSTFYLRNFAPNISEKPTMIGYNTLWMRGRQPVELRRLYPVFQDDPYIENFLRITSAREPFIEQLNENTMYFRLASFNIFYRANLDSIIDANRAKITSTRNLIIDFRDNGGGDPAFPLLEYLYTNPIRIFGRDLLASEKNIQALYDLSQGINLAWDVMGRPSEGVVNAVKDFGASLYEQVRDRVGKFVSVFHTAEFDGEESTIGERTITFDQVHPYPKNVGIIVNGWTGSAAELYVLAARQSRKVKIFGESNTRGMIDTSMIANGLVESPCGEIWLQYTAFRAAWVPAMILDDVGIQPDFLIDSSVPSYRQVQHVSNIMNSW